MAGICTMVGAIQGRRVGTCRAFGQLPVQIEMLIVRCKQDKPHWGAPKIRERLARLCPDVHTPATRCRRSSAAQARALRRRQPAEAATPSNYFLCRDPGAGFAPSCLGECAIPARHEGVQNHVV